MKTTASASIVTRNLADITTENGNVYEAISIISKRANQLSLKLKEELSEKLAEFATTVDNLEEVFENREQIEISKQYERQPKPTSQAIEEFIAGELHYETPEAAPVIIPRELF
ncbi:MAG: DNA-directed RNA polymerase subunit omega [Cytophagaceae bacterium]|nr:MAG: DNA-directed RNA polymerase subunit omega [Cytophagaceae bacterium]